MSNQRIENRYTVFKDADLEEAAKGRFISNHDLETIRRVEQSMFAYRHHVQRKSAMQYVVFQSNWEVFKDAKKLLQWYIDRPLVTFNEIPRGLPRRGDDHTGNPRLSEHG